MIIQAAILEALVDIGLGVSIGYRIWHKSPTRIKIDFKNVKNIGLSADEVAKLVEKTVRQAILEALIKNRS